MNNIVRIGIAGATGLMGSIRMDLFSDEPRAQVVAASARNQDALRDKVGDRNMRLYAAADEMYADGDVDAVCISVPNTLHYEHVKRALEAGKHVMCEYPLTNSIEQYDELIELAKLQNLVLHNSMTMRAESLHLTVKKGLARLGEPRAALLRYWGISSWYVNPALRGNQYCALHIHFIDQFRDIFGEPFEMTAHGAERDGKVSSMAFMKWDSGVVGCVEFGMGFALRPSYSGSITTTDGWLEFGPSASGMAVTLHQADEDRILAVPPDTSKQEDTASFLDEILGAGGPQYDLATARETLRLCLSCGA